MTDKSSNAMRGVIAVAVAAVLAGTLAYVFGTRPAGERDEQEAREHEGRSEQREVPGNAVPDAILAAAEALHPGRVVEAETKGRGNYEIETVTTDGMKWKMVFDADGKLLRDERD